MRAGWIIGGIVALILISRGRSGMIALKQLLVNEEGLRLTVYRDKGGAWTVGYGHLIQPSDGLYPYTDKRSITQAEADAFFAQDTAIASSAVSRNVTFPVNENQRVALTSLAYNIGQTAFADSTLVRKLNAGDVRGAAEEFKRWVYDNGVRDEILVGRRERERELFLA